MKDLIKIGSILALIILNEKIGAKNVANMIMKRYRKVLENT